MNISIGMLRFGFVAALIVMTFSLGACAKRGPGDHESFASADAAAAGLVAAIEADDKARLALIVGPNAEGVVDSGDPVADQNARAKFIAAYKEKHELVADGDDKLTLQVGADGWPLPLPIVKRDGRWYVDGAGGADELIFRRVGRNELGTIAVMHGYVEAQRDYAADPHDDTPAGVYATKIISDPGLHNGLYYETAEGEPESPLGPGVAAAAAEGYQVAGATTYHGYHFRPLYGQTDAANGGAKSYYDEGLLVNGFALIAWPAEYGESGVMTFIVNQDDVVFQKDLGDDTDTVVESITEYSPDSTWTAVTPEPET